MANDTGKLLLVKGFEIIEGGKGGGMTFKSCLSKKV